jgi:hypothetical protein
MKTEAAANPYDDVGIVYRVSFAGAQDFLGVSVTPDHRVANRCISGIPYDLPAGVYGRRPCTASSELRHGPSGSRLIPSNSEAVSRTSRRENESHGHAIIVYRDCFAGSAERRKRHHND